MYPAQTSLIPATVALIRFAERYGFWMNYPHWYLGSTPFKYLIGPVVPVVSIGLHKVFPFLSFFNLAFILFFISYFLYSVGWGLLSFKLSKSRRIGIFAGILSLILPLHWMQGLGFSELSSVVSLSILPYVLLFSLPIIESKRLELTAENILRISLAVLFFWLLLLTNTISAIQTIAGLGILAIISKNGPSFKRIILVILTAWILTFFWYGPGYWLVLFGAPSYGGRSTVGAVVWLIGILRSFVPFILAVFVVFWGARVRDNYYRFALSWFGFFALLTLVRFFANPAFWLDWITWFSEIEIGIALLAARKLESRRFYLFFTFLVFLAWIFAFDRKNLWLPKMSIEKSIEFRMANLLNDLVKPGQRVFLSGTTAFWLNAFYDIDQVRGGVDQVSVDPNWRDAVWEVRYGQSPQKSVLALKKLKVEYLVVHTTESQEFYHDFLHPEKFEDNQQFQKIYQSDGDLIYKLSD